MTRDPIRDLPGAGQMAAPGDGAVLRLAAQLYEASNTSPTRFADRDRTVRDAWAREARRQLSGGTAAGSLQDRPPTRGGPAGGDGS